MTSPAAFLSLHQTEILCFICFYWELLFMAVWGTRTFWVKLWRFRFMNNHHPDLTEGIIPFNNTKQVFTTCPHKVLRHWRWPHGWYSHHTAVKPLPSVTILLEEIFSFMAAKTWEEVVMMRQIHVIMNWVAITLVLSYRRRYKKKRIQTRTRSDRLPLSCLFLWATVRTFSCRRDGTPNLWQILVPHFTHWASLQLR